jgi:hypothetical protein
VFERDLMGKVLLAFIDRNRLIKKPDEESSGFIYMWQE